jgi:uncharacterized protein (TIGR02996 family)
MAKKHAKLSGKDPWVVMALEHIGKSPNKRSWSALIKHAGALKSIRPTQKWRRQASELIEKIGASEVEDALLQWLHKTPEYAKTDKNGNWSHMAMLAHNGPIVRGLLLATSHEKRGWSDALHVAAAAFYRQVSTHGARSIMAGNACVRAMSDVGADNCVGALLDLARHTDDETALNAIGVALESIAQKRGTTRQKLEGGVSQTSAEIEKKETKANSQTLLDAIYESPGDDGLRAVYADKLTEEGDPRGEFIVLQLSKELNKKQEARVSTLLKRHQTRWLGELAPLFMKGGLRFERGFPVAARLKAKKRAPLFAFRERAAWSTFEDLDVNCTAHGSESDRNVDQFLQDADLHLLSLRGLNLRNLASLIEGKVSFQPQHLGLQVKTSQALPNTLKTVSRKRTPFLAKVQSLRATGTLGDLDWLSSLPWVQKLREFDASYWQTGGVQDLAIAQRLLASLQRVHFQRQALFGNGSLKASYQFERIPRKKNKLSIRYRPDAESSFKVRYILNDLRVIDFENIDELTIKLNRKLSARQLSPLRKHCDSLNLEVCDLPLPK